MKSKKLSFGRCLKELMKFVKPYRLRLSVALLMVVVSNLTYALNPMTEGRITTQLTADAKDILKAFRGRMCILKCCTGLWEF